MKRYIPLWVVALLCLAIAAYAWNPFVVCPGDGSAVCDQASDTTIIGINTSGSESTKSANSINLSLREAQYNCTVDNIHLYLTNFTSGEYVTVGIYSADGNTLHGTSDQIQGDNRGDFYTFTFSPAVSLDAGTWYNMAWHASATIAGHAVSGQAAGNKTKTIDRGSYSSTLPSTVDVTSMTDTYSWRMYGTNP